MPSRARALEHLVVSELEAAKAEGVVSIGLAGKTTIADYMVIASGRSQRQVAAMAERLIERLKKEGYGPLSAEGLGLCDWVVIDAGDVIVHLFRPEVRAFYNLEKMWAVELPSNAAIAVGEGPRAGG